MIVGAYFWLIGPRLGLPLVYDDVSFALGAQAVAATGQPFGNQGYLLHLSDQRQQWALWHPPLYVYALGLITFIMGSSETSMRLLGVACQLLTAGVTWRLAVLMTPAGLASSWVGPLAAAFFLLCPLTLQSSQVLDIDNTVLTLLISVSVWLAARRGGGWSPAYGALVAVVLALGFWAKVTSPIVVCIAIVFTRFWQPGGVRLAGQGLSAAILGIAGFALTWWGISQLLGWPISYTFDVIRAEAAESALSSAERFASPMAFIAGAAPAILWLSPGLTLLFLLAGLPRLRSLVAGRGLTGADVIVVCGAALYLPYVMKLAGGFAKYHAPVVPLWAACAAALVAPYVSRLSPMSRALAAGWCAMSITLLEPWAADWEPVFQETLIWSGLVAPLVAFAGGCALALLLRRESLWRALLVGLLTFTMATDVSLGLNDRTAPGSTAYYRGRIGQREAAVLLNTRLRNDQVFVASKDVAWYASSSHFVDQESWQFHVWEERHGQFDGSWMGSTVTLLALEVSHEPTWKAYRAVLDPAYELVGQAGSYAVYQRK